MAQSEFVGVDSCPYGWFSVGFSNRYPDMPELEVFSSFKKLLEHYAAAKLILVDIPIGLPERTYGRVCDWKAKSLLSSRQSTVFPAPTRAAVEYLASNPHYADVVGSVRHEFAEAVQNALGKPVRPDIAEEVEHESIKAVCYAITKGIQKEITGKSLSVQTLGIILKIAQVDNLLPRNEPPYIREVHPEICFWALNGENAIVSQKDTQEGRRDRITALNDVGVEAQKIFDAASKQYLRKQVSLDDILDALAAAVTAREGWCRNALRTLPDDPPVDEKDRRMEMVFWRP